MRPLLVHRKDLRLLAGLGQTWREDPSNLEPTRLRTRMRHQILPMIENELQPAIVPHLARLAAFAREDESFWNALVAERMLALTRREKGRLGIRRADLLAPADFLTRAGADCESQRPLSQRLVRALLAALPGEPRQIIARHVDDVLRLAEECRSGHRIELPRALAERSFDWIWFEDRPFAITETAVVTGSPSRDALGISVNQLNDVFGKQRLVRQAGQCQSVVQILVEFFQA